MKKILLTTSALTLLAGAAAADVNTSGYGRIGVSSTAGKTNQYLRMNINFSGTSTTDGGLTLNAQTSYRANDSATGLFSGVAASISNGSMTLNVGNSGGAIYATAGIWGCGAIMWGCSDLASDTWSDWATRTHKAGGSNAVRLDMALGGASVSISGGNDNDAELAVSMPMGSGTVGIGYDTDHKTAAVTAVDASVDSVDADGVYVPGAAAIAEVAEAAAHPITQINYSGSVGDIGVGVKLMQQNAVNAYMASVTAPAGGGSVYIFAGKQLDTNNNYGIRYNQSLGGGASMQVGATNAAGETTIGAGVQFGF
jgi:outer membrane protein OmpU